MTDTKKAEQQFTEDRHLAHAAIVQASIDMNEFRDMDALRSLSLASSKERV